VLQHWTTTGHLIQSIPVDVEGRLVSTSNDGTVWFWGFKWTGSNTGVGMLGEDRGGSVQFFTAPGGDVFYVGPIIGIVGSVWYGDCCGQVSRYTP
jgi:hypothetical protein